MAHTITVYIYDWKTKEYLFADVAEEDPLTPGSYILPPYSTTIKPPNKVQNSITVFDPQTEKWQQTKDHRGEHWFNGNQKIEVDFLGDPVRLGYTKEKQYCEYTPPNLLGPLQPWQFWGLIRGLDLENELWTWVNSIEDPLSKGFASAMLEFTTEFHRYHPLIEEAREYLGLTVEQLDDLWQYANRKI